MQAIDFRCKTCENILDISTAIDGVVECPYCYNKWIVPKQADPAVIEFLRMGEHDLDTGRFDDAYTAYSKAAEYDDTEPEAYFGKALAKFKIQYLKNEVNGNLQPICHALSKEKFSDDIDYMRAYKWATAAQREEYERRANEIDHIRSEFAKMEASGLDYNCFICVKVRDENKQYTEDSKDADYIYKLLQEKGYKPFYSEYEIRNKQGTDYEAHILYALKKSECMLIVCRNEEYLQTKWVKNEYTRFLKLIAAGEKEADSLTFVFFGRPVENLPGRDGKLQGIDFANRSADRQIEEFVEKHTPEFRAKQAAEKAAKEREAEEQKARLANMQKMLEEQQRKMQEQLDSQRRAMEERLSASSEAAYTSAAPVFSKSKLLNLITAGRYGEAQSYFNNAGTVTDPEVWYLGAVALLEGKKAFMAQRSAIDKAVSYLNSAVNLCVAKNSPAGIYHYFLAYIKYDYFERKYLNVSPNFRAELQAALRRGVTEGQKAELYSLLHVARPSCL